MTKVSVVVPVYNTEKYLVKCLESLVKQTLQDIEIVIVDDGSTDNSSQIIEQYRCSYSNVKVFTKENGGQATARNLGITKCSGEYIGFMDSDDYVALDMFENMYQRAITENADFVECNYRYVKVNGQEELELKTYGDVRPYLDNRDMFFNPLVSPWNKLYKAELLQNPMIYFPEGYIYEDTSFFIKAIPYIKKSVYVNEPYVTHILRDSSTMNINKSKKIGDIFYVLEDIINCFQQNKLDEAYKNELEYFCVKILLCSSLERISKIQDKKLKKQFVENTLLMIQRYFKEYKKNPYLKKGSKNLYMKTINSFTINIYCVLFRWMNIEHGGR